MLAALLIAQADGQPAPERVTVQAGQWTAVTVHISLRPGEVDGYGVPPLMTCAIAQHVRDTILTPGAR
ncbi:hypothetical protein [Deinococcus radiotolerans]|uniref:Uncharacterized protein n=1 Tax=Deinococcus radiotolerans TaxID=1309407 RepID=A0ABQ2FR92_9DEIO|nr:hypothetical protein [Deinococcus radiotolerans]GGL18462.1 hypothetical protein GCM10010844_41640 [Deinococcus radiotolerans]